MNQSLMSTNSNVLDGYRYEIKIPLERPQYESFFPSFYQLGLYPSTQFPDRKVQSIYYDTQDFSDYSDNLSGVANRLKTRIRWYNDERSNLTLERKIKNNKAAYKKSIKLANPDRVHPQTKDELEHLFGHAENAKGKQVLEGLRPVLEVHYNRQYFQLAPDLRMTIDRDQKFRRLHPLPVARFVNSPVYAVVEFKYPAVYRERMQTILRGLPYRVFRHSKYLIGIDSTVL